MIKLDLRKKLIHNESLVSSTEGLGIKIYIDVVYRLENQTARDTYVNVGPNYAEILVIPLKGFLISQIKFVRSRCNCRLLC